MISPRSIAGRLRRADPRFYQIAVLSSLLIYGAAGLGFDVRPSHAAAVLLAALAAQYACGKWAGLATFDPLSALISALSLCLLLRTNSLAAAIAAAVVAISSKFVIRAGGAHIFNPTNFAIVVMLLCGAGWVSPAQWGSRVWFATLVAGLGFLVVQRSSRWDVTVAFLAAWAGLLFGRALYLGDPLSIPLRQVQGGALLIFAFFMISDPKTTPRARQGRLLFACLVALGAFVIQFVLYRTNGLLWSLVALCPLVPLINRLLPGPRYAWRAHPASTHSRHTIPSRHTVPLHEKGALT